MAQIIVINDTGAVIAKETDITLDGVNHVPPVKYINAGSMIMMGSIATSLATPVVLAATASAPSTGNYVYRSAGNKISLGVAMQTWHVLVLDAQLEDELIRT